jgi:tripartite-type tricarboxylate transporter receptor subunit TctC
MFKRRTFLLAALLPRPAFAQWQPERTIRMVAPFAAGGANYCSSQNR